MMGLSYINLITNLLKAGFLVSVVFVSIFIAQNTTLINEPLMASAITFDLIITLPFAYWFFIRKTKILKQTITIFISLGFIIASLILPQNNRQFLDLLKYFVMPVFETGLFVYFGFLIYRVRKTYKSDGETSRDFLENLRETLLKEFPPKVLAKVLTLEIAGIYYAILKWKTKRGKNSFTYHKQNGTVPLLIVFGFIVTVEIIILHFLIAKLSIVAAWILTASSLYLIFQIFAHGKAIFLRPIEIADDKLFIRCGLFGDGEIDLKNIESVEKVAALNETETDWIKLSPLGDFTACNLKITLHNEAVLNGIYGRKKNFKTIYISVDDAENFILEIKNGV